MHSKKNNNANFIWHIAESRYMDKYFKIIEYFYDFFVFVFVRI